MKLNSKQLREKLTEKQAALAKVFEEARSGDSDQLDFTRVDCLGEGVKGNSIAVAEKVREMNAELDEIAQQCETVESAEQAERDLKRREKLLNRVPLPADSKGPDDDGEKPVKSLGEIVCKQKRYQEWAKSGAAGGITFSFPDVLPSDVLAKGSAQQTLGAKTLFQTTAGWAPESLRIGRIVEAVTRPIQLLDIIPLAQTGFEQIVYMEETTRTHSAAEKAEGVAFAESTFALTEQTSPVRKITDSIPVTDEQLEDVVQAESYLNARLTFGLRQRLDSQVLIGDGIAPNLDGIKNVAGIQTQALGADPRPDAFYKLMTKIRVTGRAMPTHHVIHPTDWEKIRLLRTADGVYIWGNPSEAGTERMWGLPVVQSDADSAGTGYVGSFMQEWISLFERRGIDVQVGYSGTQFVEGKRTIRGDMRAAFVLFRPAAFGTVTGL